MQTLILVLVLCSALLHATWNAFLHTSADRFRQLGLMAIPYLLCSVAVLFVVPTPARESWPYIGASALLQFGYCAALVRAYSSGDFSQIYPIARGLSPLLIAVGALVFAGERLHPLAAAGIALVSAGIVSLAFARMRFSVESVPAALLTGVFIAGYSIVDGIGVRLAGSTFGYIAWIYFLFNVPIALIVWRRYGTRAFLLDDPKGTITGITGGVIAMLAYGIVIQAFRFLPIAMVSALRELSSIFAVLIGWVFMSERLTMRRVCACALVTVGAVLMRV
jgi:drug/metabolite transporter (DMT)-like permease